MEIGCNGTRSETDEEAMVSAARRMGFGTGSDLTASHLLFGFSLSLIIGMLGEGLNSIELLTIGTTYHLILQRIYRQLMLIGIISFMMSFFIENEKNQTYPLPISTGFMNGFHFSDLTLFITSIYFCLQGFLTILISKYLSILWNRSSKILTNELQMDLDKILSHHQQQTSFSLWKRRFYPFHTTRNQVEFRIFQSIFTSAYQISTKHTELDFCLFLIMTHENNVMNIINFDSWKIILILFLIGLGSMKVQFYQSSCMNPVCEAEEEIWIFTCCGVVIFILSVLLFYWGRLSEILLIQKSGVENIDDYPVFLMVESKMQIQFEKNVLKTSNVKSAINELMVEAESAKLEAEAKKRKHPIGRLKQTARLISTINTTTRPLKKTPSPTIDVPIPERESDSEVKPFTPPRSERPLRLSPMPSTAPLPPHSPKSSSSAQGMLKYILPTRGSSDIRQETCDLEITGGAEAKVDFFSKINPMNLFSNQTSVVVPIAADIEAQDPAPIETHSPMHRRDDHPPSYCIELEGHQRPRSNSSSNRSPWKKARQLLRKFSSVEGDNAHEKKKIKTKIKTNYSHQKFPDVFPFHRPEIFYLLLHALITCNSLYLALWTTNFAIIANRSDQRGHTAMLIILSILPAVLAFPFVSQAIKSSSILKAVTKLDLDVLSAVVEQTEARIHVLKTFRENLTNFLVEVNGSEFVHRIAVNQLYEEFNVNCDGLTYEEFLDLIQGCHLHITKSQTKLIYDEMDINQDGSVTMEVRLVESWSEC